MIGISTEQHKKEENIRTLREAQKGELDIEKGDKKNTVEMLKACARSSTQIEAQEDKTNISSDMPCRRSASPEFDLQSDGEESDEVVDVTPQKIPNRSMGQQKLSKHVKSQNKTDSKDVYGTDLQSCESDNNRTPRDKPSTSNNMLNVQEEEEESDQEEVLNVDPDTAMDSPVRGTMVPDTELDITSSPDKSVVQSPGTVVSDTDLDGTASDEEHSDNGEGVSNSDGQDSDNDSFIFEHKKPRLSSVGIQTVPDTQSETSDGDETVQETMRPPVDKEEAHLPVFDDDDETQDPTAAMLDTSSPDLFGSQASQQLVNYLVHSSVISQQAQCGIDNILYPLALYLIHNFIYFWTHFVHLMILFDICSSFYCSFKCPLWKLI